VTGLRIAQIVSAGHKNGAGRHCLALSTALARRGHEVLLVHRPSLDVSDAEAAGVRCFPSVMEQAVGEFGRLARLFRREGVQVTHTHCSAAHLVGSVVRLMGGPPAVATAHARHAQPHWWVNDQVMVFNDRTAAYMRRVNRVARRRIHVVPAFLGLQWPEAQTPERKAEARRRLGIPQEALVVGQIGDIHFDKRQSDLVQAARGLLARRPEARVALKGIWLDQAETRRVMQAAEGFEDRLIRLDWTADVRDDFHAYDIFVISSRTEQLPNVAVEAMAAGLPIVSTRVGRMEALLGDSGGGLLAAPRDVAGLADAIDRLADDADLRRRMGDAARRRALEERDSEAAIDRIEAVLALAADRRRGAPIPSPVVVAA